MKLSKKGNSLLTCMIMLLIFFCSMLVLYFNIEKTIFLQICVLATLLFYLFEIVCIIKITGKIFHPVIFFLASFYVFQNGQFLLIALNVPFNSFYINSLSYLLPQAIIFSSISAIFAGLACIITVDSVDNIEKNIKLSKLENYDIELINHAASIGLCITGFVAIILVLIKFFGYAIHGGYMNVQYFENKVPSIFNLMEYMYVPFTILYLCFNQNKQGKKIVKVLFYVWCIFTALCGDRTSGIAGILVIVLVEYSSTEDKKMRKKQILKIFLVGVFCMLLINLARMFRDAGSIDLSNKTRGGLLVNLFAELGFNSFSIMTMMNIVPKQESFFYGSQYVQSFIKAIFPHSLDVFGIIDKITKDSFAFVDWQFIYYSQYDFGLGFSLNAEAYINFGWYGLFAIFIICCIVCKNLSNDFALTTKSRSYGTYKTLVLLFTWLTLARRSSYTIWNALFWCVIVMNIYLWIMCSLYNYSKKPNGFL